MTSKRNSKLQKSLATLELQDPRTMGRKSRIQDCYETLESVAWIWRLLGVFPLTVRQSMGMKGYGMNKYYAIHSILIFIGCFVTIVLSFIQIYKYMRDRLTIEHVTIVIRAFANVLCLFLISIWRVIRHKEITKSVESMAAQDVFLEKMGCRLNYESNAKIIRIYIWVSLIIVTIFVAYDFYSTVKAMESVALQWLFWFLPQIAQVIDLSILVVLVGLLGVQFRALNDKIRTIAIRANAASPKIIVTSDVCANNLQLVAKAHYNICAVGKEINRFFDWDIIINVIVAFIILSTTLYYIFVEVQRDEETDYVRIGTYFHWEFIHSVPIILIVLTCNWTTNQSIQTGKLIHEIRLIKKDSRLYETVKSFSLQLHHQKLEFNAGGFFPINSTLLQTV